MGSSQFGMNHVMTSMPVGVLLAAGLGTRYDPSGRYLKLLQPTRNGKHAGYPIAVAAARNLKAAVERVIAVVRPQHHPHQPQLHGQLQQEGCELVVCAGAAEGIGASLTSGIRACAEAEAWLVALADMPTIDPSTIRTVVEALRSGCMTAAPSYRGQRGHPVGFSARCRNELLRSDGNQGAKSVLDIFTPHLIDVDDDGILIDVDFPP